MAPPHNGPRTATPYLGRNSHRQTEYGAGGIVVGCGTFAMVVLAGINCKVDYERLSPELTEMVVICPRGGKRQSIRLGNSACTVCGLRISIRIEEPRCPRCDYLLYGLISDRCPEGRTVIGIKTPAGE